jgi:hypothetical protein
LVRSPVQGQLLFTEKKPAATDPLGVAAGLLKAFLCLALLGLQHFTPTFRLPAPLKEEEAVSKSEIIKGARASHRFELALDPALEGPKFQ